MEPTIELNRRIRAKEEELETKKKELEALKEKREEMFEDKHVLNFAEFLHEKLCTANHTDGCCWYYEKWKLPLGYTKERYLTMAKELLAQVDESVVRKVITIIKG